MKLGKYLIFVFFLIQIFFLSAIENEVRNVKACIKNQTEITLPKNYKSVTGIEILSLEIIIGTDYKIKAVNYLKGPKSLLDLAKEYLNKWEVSPEIVDDKPVESKIDLDVVFQKKDLILANSTDIKNKVLKENIDKTKNVFLKNKILDFENPLYVLENYHIYAIDDYSDFYYIKGFSLLPSRLKSHFVNLHNQLISNSIKNNSVKNYGYDFYLFPVPTVYANVGLAPKEMNYIDCWYQKGNAFNIKNFNIAFNFFAQDGEWISTYDTANNFTTHLQYITFIGLFEFHYNFVDQELTTANIKSNFIDNNVLGNVNHNDKYPNGTAYLKKNNFDFVFKNNFFDFGTKFQYHKLENDVNFKKNKLEENNYFHSFINLKSQLKDIYVIPKFEYISNYENKENICIISVENFLEKNKFKFNSLMRWGYPYNYFLNSNLIYDSKIGDFGLKINFWENNSELLYSVSENESENSFYYEKEFTSKASVTLLVGLSNKYNAKQKPFYNFKFVLPLDFHNFETKIENNFCYRNVVSEIYPNIIDRFYAEIVYKLKHDNAIFVSSSLFAHSCLAKNSVKYDSNHLWDSSIGVQITKNFRIWVEFKNISNRNLFLDTTSGLLPYGYDSLEQNQHSNVRFEWFIVN